MKQRSKTRTKGRNLQGLLQKLKHWKAFSLQQKEEASGTGVRESVRYFRTRSQVI